MKNITKIDHVGIVTKNLEESIGFFEKQLGLKVTHVEDMPERGIRVAVLPLGQTKIELIEQTGEQSEISSFLQKKGAGLHHIALSTSDIEADMAHMKENNVTLTSEKPTNGAQGKKVVFVHPKSSGGVLIELTQNKSS